MRRTRNTTQRMKILEYLSTTKTHPAAEEVFTHVRKYLPSITLATVYRNLNLLSEQGIILKFKINNKWHFDGHGTTHQHAVDVSTGKIFDVHQPELARYVLEQVKLPGFKAESVRIMFFGKKMRRLK